MDPVTQSPDPPQRASSSEPSSTRPNPFDDSDVHPPKRRRTSGSVESLNHPPDNSSTSATLDEDDEGASDTAVKMDSDPATPKTPEPASSSSDHHADPPSSKVTINLRNDPHNGAIPSSPSYRPRHSEMATDDAIAADQAAEFEVDLVRGGSQGSQGSQSSSPVSASPPVELVREPDDEDIDLGTPIEGVPIEEPNRYVVDPTERFPYQDPHERLYDTAQRLVNYISSQPLSVPILNDVQQWLATYIEFLGVADSYSVARSLRLNRDFWLAFPDIAFAMSNRSPPLLKSPALRPVIMRFYGGFIRLSVYLLGFDVESIHEAQVSLAANRRQSPELYSGKYLYQLYLLTRCDATTDEEDASISDGPGSTLDDARVILDKLRTILGGGLGILEEYSTSLIDILSDFPRLFDYLAYSSQVLSNFMNEAAARIRTASNHEDTQAAESLLENGHELWVKISACLSMLIEKHVTQLGGDGISNALSPLTEVLKLCVTGSHDIAVEQVERHRQHHPQLPPSYTPDALALEWRFDMHERLIRCSQMQLRLVGVTTMCAELVAVWKRFGEDPANPLLKHVAEYLLRSGIIEYILGPNCHPEIIVEAANIVGFLVVTKMYQKDHTDRIWHGITSSQDPRVADALTRMIINITNLFDYTSLSDLCGKLEELPLSCFTTSIQTLWADNMMRQMMAKSSPDRATLSYQPYKLCLRLLRESSVCTNGSEVAHPEMQGLAMQRLRELLKHGPDPAGRAELYRSCLEDVSQKTQTTLGSLWCLSLAIRPTPVREMQILTQEHDLTRLIVEELEHAVLAAAKAGVTSVLAGNTNIPRLEFVSNILRYQPKTVDEALGEKLWDVLVGPRSLSREDREAGWRVLNNVVASADRDNPFIRTCFSRYLPTLPPTYLCEGTLEFVRDEALSLVQENEDFHLDDESAVRASCVEQLWRIILAATNPNLVHRAIHTLAVEVYMDSKLLSDYPTLRTRQVHSSLVNRCFTQLRESGDRIKAAREGSSDGEDDSMVIVATEDQLEEQGRTFTRSLQFLRYFLEAHQSKPQFAAPDLRPLMLQAPSKVIGDPTQLKYQSFDGMQQTDIRPLYIGRRNTAASLLTKIKYETGFENFSAYYRGRPFLPTERDVRKSLEDLQIHSGLILVKREKEEQGSGSKYKPGSSSLQIEVMSHFQEMWEYLNLEEHLASEIYHFLIRLPADISVLESFQDPTASYTDIFPPGQPFRSLYAMHALIEYKELSARLESSGEDISDSEMPLANSYTEARQRAVTLIIQAILDPNVSLHSTASLQLQVTSSLMRVLVQWLQDPDWGQEQFDAAKLGVNSAERFVAVLLNATKSDEDAALPLIVHALAAVLRLGLLDIQFWESVEMSQDFREVAYSLILFDRRKQVRALAIQMIQDVAENEEELPDPISNEGSHHVKTPYPIARYFWYLGLDLIPKAMEWPGQCNELFTLTLSLIRRIFVNQRSLVDLHAVAVLTSELLMSHESIEDINQVEPFDLPARGLASLLLICLQTDESIAGSVSLPKDLAFELYWRLLFPRTREQFEQPVPKVILNSETRAKLCEVIFRLVKDDRNKFSMVLNSINDVLPYFTRDEDPYLYEIPGSFDSSKAMRAPCGYVGLRNLSNTCYLNSLLTQLFMYTDFRHFIMSAPVTDPEDTQELLYFTKKVFGFMQESYRRFIDPVDFVQSIRTYDDTLIDIHNQMDVDEFYNLLFDRWEGQLQNTVEKRQLRSFFGGQLVQQIKSKECEHISERLEPFSAIQCDIKGKKSLEESLQAYVDGEVLEGDNKYKCSTCDNHVDAVKRACLKDLPDNMIFHLKRFDFNLRTLQRSKINDYFAFPERINLKPYTVEHLRDPDTEGEDIFELVGVLVHAGTAESGHYYSYIRERPTGLDRPSWIEFNDDSVIPWDPVLLESSTFGGPDNRPHFDSSGVLYDKSYSAYMLFYQRASSLSRQQEQAVVRETPIPVHVDLDSQQQEFILDENTNLLRRHCLFDPAYALWVKKFFEQASHLDATIGADNSEPMTVEGSPSDGSTSGEKLQDLAMETLLSHLDQIVSRKKDLPDFSTFMATLDKAIGDSAEDAYSFYKYFYLRPPALRSLLLRNPEPIVRQRMSSQFLHAVQKISIDMPQYYSSTPRDEMDSEEVRQSIGQALASGRHGVPVLGGVMHIFRHLWKHFHIHIRAWDEHFHTILGFAKMGDREVAHLFADDYLLKLCRIVAADPSVDLPANYTQMLRNIFRRLNNRPPSYWEVIALIEYLIRQYSASIGPETIVESPTERLHTEQKPFCWTSDEVAFLHAHPEGRNYSYFVEKLLTIDQHPSATDDIVVRLSQTSDQMDAAVAECLMINIGQDASSQLIEPFLRVAVTYVDSTTIPSRAEKIAAHIAAHAKHLHAVDIPVLIEFFHGALNLQRPSTQFAKRLHDYCLELIPQWAPIALAHPSIHVRNSVGQILAEELFAYPPDHDPGEDTTAQEKHLLMIGPIQRLGVRCLLHLQDAHVNRRVAIGREQATTVVETAKRCREYFQGNTGALQNLTMEFHILQEEIMEPLRQLIVEQVDDNGTDWEGSCASSDQMDGITAEMSMQAMNELNDTDAA